MERSVKGWPIAAMALIVTALAGCKPQDNSQTITPDPEPVLTGPRKIWIFASYRRVEPVENELTLAQAEKQITIPLEQSLAQLAEVLEIRSGTYPTGPNLYILYHSAQPESELNERARQAIQTTSLDFQMQEPYVSQGDPSPSLHMEPGRKVANGFSLVEIIKPGALAKYAVTEQQILATMLKSTFGQVEHKDGVVNLSEIIVVGTEANPVRYRDVVSAEYIDEGPLRIDRRTVVRTEPAAIETEVYDVRDLANYEIDQAGINEPYGSERSEQIRDSFYRQLFADICSLAPETWKAKGISIQQFAGQLVVQHNREVHQGIEQLLAQMRAKILTLTIEGRFVTLPQGSPVPAWPTQPTKGIYPLTVDQHDAFLAKLRQTDGVTLTAAPRITTLNKVGARVRIGKGSRYVVTLEGPEPQQAEPVEPDLGTWLQVRPNVSEDRKTIQLDFTAESSSRPEENTPRQILLYHLETSATMPDRSAIALQLPFTWLEMVDPAADAKPRTGQDDNWKSHTKPLQKMPKPKALWLLLQIQILKDADLPAP